MDIAGVLRFAGAIRVIYDLDFEPRDDAFVECSREQYHSLVAEGQDPGRRWFVVTRGIFEQTNNPPRELRLVDDSERLLLLDAARWIHSVTDRSGESFSSFHDRMSWLKERLPPALWR
jgi:hypothetical protein